MGNVLLSETRLGLQCMSSVSLKCLELLKTMVSLMSLTDKPSPNNLSATEIILYFRTDIYQKSHSKNQETDLHFQLLLTELHFLY